MVAINKDSQYAFGFGSVIKLGKSNGTLSAALAILYKDFCSHGQLSQSITIYTSSF